MTRTALASQRHILRPVIASIRRMRGYSIALQPTEDEDLLAVYFRHHQVTQIDLQHPYK